MTHEHSLRDISARAAPSPQQQPPELPPSTSAVEQPGGAVEQHEPDAPTEPRIWVGSWLDYNSGVLFGRWLDAAQSADELHAAIYGMLAASPTAASTGDVAEEWGIFDYEGFGGLRLGEQEPMERVARLAAGIAEHGPAFAAWADISTGDGDALDHFADAYLGEYESLTAYAEHIAEELGLEQQLDQIATGQLRSYLSIDYEALGQDLWLSGDVTVAHSSASKSGPVWLFDGRY